MSFREWLSYGWRILVRFSSDWKEFLLKEFKLHVFIGLAVFGLAFLVARNRSHVESSAAEQWYQNPLVEDAAVGIAGLCVIALLEGFFLLARTPALIHWELQAEIEGLRQELAPETREPPGVIRGVTSPQYTDAAITYGMTLVNRSHYALVLERTGYELFDLVTGNPTGKIIWAAGAGLPVKQGEPQSMSIPVTNEPGLLIHRFVAEADNEPLMDLTYHETNTLAQLAAALAAGLRQLPPPVARVRHNWRSVRLERSDGEQPIVLDLANPGRIWFQYQVAAIHLRTDLSPLAARLQTLIPRAFEVVGGTGSGSNEYTARPTPDFARALEGDNFEQLAELLGGGAFPEQIINGLRAYRSTHR